MSLPKKMGPLLIFITQIVKSITHISKIFKRKTRTILQPNVAMGWSYPIHLSSNRSLTDSILKLTQRKTWLPLLLALFGTVSLLLLMVTLIRTDFTPPVPVEPMPTVTVQQTDIVEQKTMSKPEKPIKTQEPSRVKPLVSESPNEVTTAGPDNVIKRNPGSEQGTPVTGLPMVAPQPKYPNSAARRGTEGWVVVEYYVDQYGRTVQATVIERHPSGVFDQSALNAISGYRYQPVLQKNASIKLRGPYKQKLVFTMEK
jgi:protein TonB